MRLRVGLLAVPAVLLCSVARAQAASSPPPSGVAASPGSGGIAPAGVPSMSFDEALRYARTHQPEVRAALARVAAAEVTSKIARAQWLPSATAGVELFGATANNTTASYLGVPGVDIARIGGTAVARDGSWKPYASTLAAVSAQQELFDFGRIAAQAAVGDAIIEVQKHGADATWLAIALGVEQSFFAVRAAHAIVTASEHAYERAHVHRDFAEAKVKAGLFPPIDLTRAEADLARFDVGRIHAAGALESAEAVFAASVGSPSRVLDAAGEAPPGAELPSVDQALSLAQRRDPELLGAIARREAQRAVTRATDALARPNLSLSAALSGREGGAPGSNAVRERFDGFLPDVPNWDLGVVLRVPLYDPVLNAAGDAARAEESVASNEVDVARQHQVAAVQEAFVDVKVAAASLDALEHALTAATQNYEQADARFRGGLGNVVELADAEALRVDAEIQLALGQFALARARAVLGRAIGEGL